MLIAVALALPLALAPGERARGGASAGRRVLDGERVDAVGVVGGCCGRSGLLIAGVVRGGRQALARAPRRGCTAARRSSASSSASSGRSRDRRARAPAPARARAPLGASRGALLGLSRRGEPVRVAPLRTHAMIVGGSGSGKTTTAEVLLEGEVAAGRGFVILDGKGGRALPRVRGRARRALRAAGRAVVGAARTATPSWTRRRAWNPAGGGNPTEIKDRIAAAEEQTEPYYAAIAARGLLAAARGAQQALGRAPGPRRARRAAGPPRAAGRAAASASTPTRHARDIAWLQGLDRGRAQRAARHGHAAVHDGQLRRRRVAAARSDGGEIDLYRAVTEGWLVVFTLPEGTYPALIPHVCRYALAALNAVGTRLEREGRQARAVVFVDELSAFDGDQLCGGLERGRSAGMSYIVATQSVSNFRTAGGEKLLDAVLDNSELVVIHRQTAPQAAEQLAGVAGTAEAWEHTHVVSDRFSRRLFGDESGERTRRLTEQFRAHPNDIKQLADRRGDARPQATRRSPSTTSASAPAPRSRRRDSPTRGRIRNGQISSTLSNCRVRGERELGGRPRERATRQLTRVAPGLVTTGTQMASAPAAPPLQLDARAWEQCVSNLHRELGRIASREDCQDAVQEALADALRRPELSVENLGGWVLVIARRRLLDQHRATVGRCQGRRASDARSCPPRPTTSPSSGSATTELVELLEDGASQDASEAMARLSAEHQRLLTLALERTRYPEVADDPRASAPRRPRNAPVAPGARCARRSSRPSAAQTCATRPRACSVRRRVARRGRRRRAARADRAPRRRARRAAPTRSA